MKQRIYVVVPPNSGRSSYPAEIWLGMAGSQAEILELVDQEYPQALTFTVSDHFAFKQAIEKLFEVGYAENQWRSKVRYIGFTTMSSEGVEELIKAEETRRRGKNSSADDEISVDRWGSLHKRSYP